MNRKLFYVMFFVFSFAPKMIMAADLKCQFYWIDEEYIGDESFRSVDRTAVVRTHNIGDQGTTWVRLYNLADKASFVFSFTSQNQGGYLVEAEMNATGARTQKVKMPLLKGSEFSLSPNESTTLVCSIQE